MTSGVSTSKVKDGVSDTDGTNTEVTDSRVTNMVFVPKVVDGSPIQVRRRSPTQT